MMRKKIRHTLWTAALCVAAGTSSLLTSCASEEMTVLSDQQPIRLSTACQAHTRGTSGTDSQATVFDAGAKVGVYIVTSNGTDICSPTQNNNIFTATAESGGKNTLTPPDQTRPPYYPNGDETVTIKAYYPSTVNNGTTEFSVQTYQATVSDDETADTYKLSDLMTATATGVVKSSNDVSLLFHHRMAKIKINAEVDKTDGTNTDPIIITGIQLTNVYTKANYNTNDTWSGTGDTGTIIVAKDGTETSLNGVALFPPQTITGKTFIQVSTSKGPANYAVTSKEFQEGHEYTANLKVGMQNLTMTAAITDWSAASGIATVTKVNKYGISIDPISETFTYNGSAQTPSSVKVWFKASGKDDVELVEGTDYTLAYYNNTNVGEALIVASGIGGTSYDGSAAVQSFVIGQATPSIALTNGTDTIPREFAWNDTYTNALTTESKYDGGVAWTSSDGDVAEVDGNGLVTIKKPGTTTIKFATDGSGNYEAVSTQYTLTITKRSFEKYVTITDLGGYNDIYDETEKRPVPVVYDGGKESGKRLGDNDGYYTISYTNNINYGTATVTCTGGGTFYDNTIATKTFTINKATPVITMSTTAQTIGIGTTYPCDATSTYGTVTYESSNSSVASVNSATGLVTALAPGTITITASVSAGDNWEATTSAQNKTISITVQNMEESFTAVGSHSYTCPVTGTYTFELIGGGGSSYNGGRGGYGGWVKASKKLDKGTVVSIYVGGAGTQGNSASGGTNGAESIGGKSGSSGGGSGGAATEIRIGGTRHLVAGGGGGASGRRQTGKDGGASSSGNYGQVYGEDVTYFSVGGGGGGGYRGGKQGGFGGGYGGSNYIDSSWTTIYRKTSTNTSNGSVKVTYEIN